MRRALGGAMAIWILGARLPEVKVLRALESPAAKAVIDTHFASATVLVLFPDWCGGCQEDDEDADGIWEGE